MKLADIPAERAEAIAQTVIAITREMFEDPRIRQEFEQWKKERKTRNEIQKKTLEA